MIDFKSINTVFLDWDNTMAIDNSEVGLRLTHADYLSNMLRENKNYYTEVCQRRPNVALRWLLKKMPDARKNILTWSKFTISWAPYFEYCRVQYPGIEFQSIYSVRNREDKQVFIDTYMREFGLSKYKVLLVEDHPITLSECSETCLCLSVPELYAYYLDRPVEGMVTR